MFHVVARSNFRDSSHGKRIDLGPIGNVQSAWTAESVEALGLLGTWYSGRTIPSQSSGGLFSQLLRETSCTQSLLSCRGKRFRRSSVMSRSLNLPGSRKQSSIMGWFRLIWIKFWSALLISKYLEPTLRTEKALMYPVLGMWGPTQRSIIGPHR